MADNKFIEEIIPAGIPCIPVSKNFMRAIFLILIALIGQLGFSRPSKVPCEVPLIEKPEYSIEETATNIRGILQVIPIFLDKMQRTEWLNALEYQNMLKSTYPHSLQPVLDKLFLNCAIQNGDEVRSLSYIRDNVFGVEFKQNPFPNSLNSLLETLKEIIKEQLIATESYVESDDFALDAMILFLNCGLICTTKDFAMQLANAENFEALGYLNFYLQIYQAVVLDFLDDKCLQNRFYPVLDAKNFSSESFIIGAFYLVFSPTLTRKLVTFQESIFRDIWSEKMYFNFTEASFVFLEDIEGQQLFQQKDVYKEFWANRGSKPLRVGTLSEAYKYTHEDPIIVESSLRIIGSSPNCDSVIPTTIDLSQVKCVEIEFNSDIAWTDFALLRNLSSRINEDTQILVKVRSYGRNIAACVLDYFYKFQVEFEAILNLHFDFVLNETEHILDGVLYDLQMKSLKIDCPMSLLVPFWKFPSLEELSLRVEDDDLMSLQSIAEFPKLKKLTLDLSSNISFTLADLLAQLNSCSENLLFINLIIPYSARAFASGKVEHGHYFILEVDGQYDIFHDLMKNLNDSKPNLSVSVEHGKLKLKDLYPNIDFIENYEGSLRFAHTKAFSPSASNE